MKEYIWYPIFFEELTTEVMLHNIYIILFFWFVIFCVLKTISYLINAKRKGEKKQY